MYRITFALCGVLSLAVFISVTLVADAASAASDQVQSIKRTPLQRFDLENSGYETIIGIAEVAPDTLIVISPVSANFTASATTPMVRV